MNLLFLTSLRDSLAWSDHSPLSVLLFITAVAVRASIYGAPGPGGLLGKDAGVCYDFLFGDQ